MNPETGLTGGATSAQGEWECLECGYVEEGAKSRRPVKCPDCGAPAQALEFFPYGDDDDETWEDGSSEDRYDENEDDDFVDDDDERPEARFIR